jgi:micrococcal nuclease
MPSAKTSKLLLGLFVFLFGLVSSKLAPGSVPQVKSATTEVETTTVIVTRVIDGDTIEIASGQKVRLIGVNAPETVDPRRPVGCFGRQASDFAKAQLTGKPIRLEKDISNKDKYGRLLRYVWLDGQLFNEELIAAGFAQVSTYPPDVKYQPRFTAAQDIARDTHRGLWGTCP